MRFKYEPKVWEPKVFPEGHPEAGRVCRVTVGVQATEEESGLTAYKDHSFKVEPSVDLDEFLGEIYIKKWIDDMIGEEGWYAEFQRTIANNMTKPVAPPREKRVDLRGMRVGARYELPEEAVDTTNEGVASTEVV